MMDTMDKMLILWLLFLQTALAVTTKESKPDDYRYCRYINKNVGRLHENGELVIHSDDDPAGERHRDSRAMQGGLLMADNQTVRCPLNCHFCYSLWLTDNGDSKVTFVKQGCWHTPNEKEEECDKTSCISHNHHRSGSTSHNNTQFCCCRGDKCNENVTQGTYVLVVPKMIPRTPDMNYKLKTILIAMTSICTVSVVTILLYLLFRLYCSRRHLSADMDNGGSYPSFVSPTLVTGLPAFSVDDIKLCSPLSRGRFGEVWRGSLCGIDVAVKVYSGGVSARQHYANERDIYMLPFMRNSAVPKFYGGGERTVDVSQTNGPPVIPTGPPIVFPTGPVITAGSQLSSQISSQISGPPLGPTGGQTVGITNGYLNGHLAETSGQTSDQTAGQMTRPFGSQLSSQMSSQLTAQTAQMSSVGQQAVSQMLTTQYLLVLEYIPRGTLSDYLKHHEIDWQTLCQLSYSISRALAFLHSDVCGGIDKIKPTIAHRDLNTRNILIRDNLSCCIADFGFAMKLMGPQSYRDGPDESAEQSLTDVGTLRYMAPEVLEGAVNLCDCEASLKQIDVYSLGLIIWEVASRCTDLYQGLAVPAYQLPFQAEVGIHPTFDEMQQVVSRNKVRPLFPDVWKDSNPAIRALKETIEDCWDQDAEARLTALCVEERILDMASLWENRHKGVSPTVNPPPINLVGNLGPDDTPRPPPTDVQTPLLRRDEMSSSTVETVLSPSDGGVTTGVKDNWNADFGAARNRERAALVAANVAMGIPAEHGHNPTMARNTHRNSDETLAICGNVLGEEGAVVTDEMVAALADNLSSSLLANGNAPIERGVQRKRMNVSTASPAAKAESGSGWLAWLRRPQHPPVPAPVVDEDEKSNLIAARRATAVHLMSGSTVVRPTSLPLGGRPAVIRRPAVAPRRAHSNLDISPAAPAVVDAEELRRPASLYADKCDVRGMNNTEHASSQPSVSMQRLDNSASDNPHTSHSQDFMC